jgi:hypothetical protein
MQPCRDAPTQGETRAATAVKQDTAVWHKRLGHVSVQVLKILLKKGPTPGEVGLGDLEQCVAGKQIHLDMRAQGGQSELCSAGMQI